jgi:hypothetical protein
MATGVHDQYDEDVYRLHSREGAAVQRVKGIYDGSRIILLDPLSLPPNTIVEITVQTDERDPEARFWQRLLDEGLVKDIRALPAEDFPVTPIEASGIPISETIIQERR